MQALNDSLGCLLCLVQKSFGFAYDVFNSKAEFLHAGSTWSGGAETIHGDTIAIQSDEAMPAKGFSGFNHDPLTNSDRKHFFFVGIALLVV